MLIISSTDSMWKLERRERIVLIPKSVADKMYKAVAIVEVDDPWLKRRMLHVIGQGWTPNHLAADAQGRACGANSKDAVVWSLAGAFMLVYDGRESMKIVAANLMVDWINKRRGSSYDPDGRGLMKISMNMDFDEQVKMLTELHL